MAKSKAMAVQKSDRPVQLEEDFMLSEGGGEEDLEQNQLVQLKSKFRCKRDLYQYLD